MFHDQVLSSEDEEDVEEEEDGHNDSGPLTRDTSGTDGSDQGTNSHQGRDAESALSDGTQPVMLSRDKQRKTAFFDYATEKQMSHSEARQFFQRHKMENPDAMGSVRFQDGSSPIIRAKTFSHPPNSESSLASQLESFSSRGKDFDRAQTLYRKHGLPQAALDLPLTQRKDKRLSAAISLDGAHARTSTTDGDVFHQTEQSARDDSKHAGLPHERKPDLLATEGIHGAGAGVGVGGGAGGLAMSDSNVTAELAAIYGNIQKVLEIRHKYIGLSLQTPNDNPKDGPEWRIYPPPPEPVWDHDKGRPGVDDGSNTVADGGAAEHETSIKSPSDGTSRRQRKAGQDIGADFVMEDLMPMPQPSEMTFRLDEFGVYQVYDRATSEEMSDPIVRVPTIREFYMDLDAILNVSSDGPSKSFAFRRLQYLEGKFNLYILLNEYQEIADSKKVPHRDFYNVRKVDTHVHHSACMNQKHLLRFIKSKMKRCPDEVVLYRDGKHLTLREVFESIKLTAYDLSIDTLDMHVRPFPVWSMSTQNADCRRHIQTHSTGLTSSISNITPLANPGCVLSF